MKFNIKNLINNIPKKLKKSCNSNKNYNNINTYSINIGKIINDKIFKKNIDERIYLKILNYLKKLNWDKKIKNDCKYYYHNDLVMIINKQGDIWCKKDKLFAYKTYQTDNNFNDFRINLYKMQKMSDELFPVTTNFHNMKYIQKIRFIKNNISYELLIINNRNKYNTYEFNLYGKDINNLIKSFVNIMLNILDQNIENINLINYRQIENYDISKLSISIL